MKNKIFKRLLIAVALILVIYPSFQAQAKVQDFSDIYMELNVPEDTIILTEDTSNMDEQWLTAGITDPKSEKDNFDEMGIQAVIYDPNTKTTVRLLKKQSTQSSNIFNLSLLTEEAQTEFFDSLVTTTDENTKSTIEKFAHPEVTFFRYGVDVINDNVPLTEIIYGTIVNGSMLSFDIYKENSTEPLDETFIKELVAGTHFTTILDKADVEKQQQTATIRLIISFTVLMAIIAVWIVLSKKRNNKLQILNKSKTEALTQFYMNQKQKEEQNIKDNILFVNRTKYSKEVIKDFCYYNEIINKLKTWGFMVLLVVAIFASLFYNSSSILSYGFVLILVFVFVYYQGIRIDKLVTRTMKSYDKNKNMEAIFTFYEDYYTFSGIQYISKYPYTQISKIKEYKDFIYIYLGSDKAIYLKKDGFEQSMDDFMKFIKQQIS